MPLEALEGIEHDEQHNPPPRRPVARATNLIGGIVTHSSEVSVFGASAPARRRRGRPPSQTRKDTMNVTLRLLRPFYGDLKDFAKKMGVPPGQVVMDAVEFYIIQYRDASGSDRDRPPKQALAAANDR